MTTAHSLGGLPTGLDAAGWGVSRVVDRWRFEVRCLGIRCLRIRCRERR